MPLTEAQITECVGHDDLLELLFSELRIRLPPMQPFHMERFLQKSRTMPVGLRAMAATFELDVSMALDDLGWHFGNWPHRGYCDETLRGLRELEALEYTEMFAKAYELAQSNWIELRDSPRDGFSKWYNASDFEKATAPLSLRWWDLQKIDGGIFGHWTKYARKYPHKVIKLISL
jgi:hypothetical protein